MLEFFIVLLLFGFFVWYFFVKDKDPTSDMVRAEDHEFYINADYKHSFKNTAIAINKERGELFLSNSVFGTKIYPFDKIKSMTWKLAGRNQYEGYGVKGAIEAIGDNIVEGVKQMQNSGIFVAVKDIDCPEWQILVDIKQSDAVMLMKRWLEIYDQLVNKNV